jgi:hypothetical protein
MKRPMAAFIVFVYCVFFLFIPSLLLGCGHESAGRAPLCIRPYPNSLFSNPRSSRGALKQYILISNTSRICTRQIRLDNTKTPAMISTSPKIDSHSQYGMKQINMITPMATRIKPMIFFTKQFPHSK